MPVTSSAGDGGTGSEAALPDHQPFARSAKGSSNMAVRLGDIAPDFTAQTTQGELNFLECLGDSWGFLFSNPKDLTPV